MRPSVGVPPHAGAVGGLPCGPTRGFYSGSDGHVWGRDFLDANRPDDAPRPLELEKHAWHWRLWGRLGYEPVMLVGHSYGGALALRYASEHPDRVRRLVIVESPVPVLSENLDALLWVKSRQQQAAENRGEDLLVGQGELVDVGAVEGGQVDFSWNHAIQRNGVRHQNENKKRVSDPTSLLDLDARAAIDVAPLAALGLDERIELLRCIPHGLEPQALLEAHDAPAPIAVAAPDGQRVVEDVEHPGGLPEGHARASSVTYGR